jgi:transposase-like protein
MCDRKSYNTLKDVADVGEIECRHHLALMRWQGKPVCPYCSSDHKIYATKTGRYKCAACKKLFSVTVGTIFHDSKLPLSTWFYALYLITSHKKGISSLQLARDLGITQKSAWFVLHRIRHAMQTKSFNAPLANTVEADETYVGGKEKNKHASKRVKGTQGRSTKTKTPVFGMVERNGRLVAMVVTRTDAKTLTPLITNHVAVGSTMMTDEFKAYMQLHQSYQHNIVRHQHGEYVRGTTHTNTIEGFWSLLKRGITGIYHWVSVKHLDKYVGEFEYRYNSRKITEGERLNMTLTRIESRLTYRQLVSA